MEIASFWKSFSSIQCIHMQHRKDREELQQPWFDKYQVPFNYFFVEKSPISGQRGCFESHIRLIEEAYARGDETVLIFEDDAMPNERLDDPVLRQSIVNFMQTHSSWGMLYLGVDPDIWHGIRETNVKGIWEGGGLNTHAYIVHRRLMEQLVGLKYTGVPIDMYFTKVRQTYSVLPVVFTQAAGHSDIMNTYQTDRISRTAFYSKLAMEWGISIQLTIFTILMLIAIWLLYKKHQRGWAAVVALLALACLAT